MERFCRLCKQEKLELLGAYVAGKKIQYKSGLSGPWVDIEDPSFNDSVYYRVKPEELCFGKRSVEDKCDLVKAFLEGAAIECKTTRGQDWKDLDPQAYHSDIPFYNTNYYRIKQ